DKEKNEKSLLLLSFTFNHERLRLSTGLHVPKNDWDQESQKAKPAKDYSEVNTRLRETANFFLDKYDELFPKGKKLTKEEIKGKSTEMVNAFKVFTGRKKAIDATRISLISFFAIFQQRYKNKISLGHLMQYTSLKKQLEAFQTKKEFRVDFETIGKDFYIQFTDYLKEIGLKPNSIGSYIKILKRLMNEANEDKLTTNQDHKKRDFKAVMENVDTVYLSENEIKALYEMPIERPAYRTIRDIFVINCYTGLRHSDWSKVSMEHIHEGNLYVRTKKTNDPVILPIKPLVLEILKRYGTLQVPAIRQTNDAMKWIGQKAFDEKISKGNLKKWLVIRTHTARRSFATNAYLSGIPMRDIMQITGHRTTESFLKYIRVTKLETAEKLKDHPFFQ
ncbi:MAG: tyrosine-type recombinase/integrase, partial [Bacteroidota bacterium]